MTTTAGVRNAVAPGVTKKAFRPDIQGLRMVAVVAVIFDHLLGWPSGGFVGVDIFFVISGFLITSLLLREQARTGGISFLGFYRRRFRRIMPAAVLVLVVTAVAAWFIFNLTRFGQTASDAFWALFFGANWHFAAIGTNYFQADGPISPLQHYWSLSVEEQFYLIWPWLMLLFFWLAGPRSSRIALRMIATAIVVLTVASFVWSMWESSSDPTWAYFSTFSRAWELGIGAIIAIFARHLQRIPGYVRPVLGWLGFIGIIVSLFVVTDSVAFPAPVGSPSSSWHGHRDRRGHGREATVPLAFDKPCKRLSRRRFVFPLSLAFPAHHSRCAVLALG